MVFFFLLGTWKGSITDVISGFCTSMNDSERRLDTVSPLILGKDLPRRSMKGSSQEKSGNHKDRINNILI